MPKGRLIVTGAKHYCAVIDGVLYDTWDSQEDGNRCVYGYYINRKAERLEQLNRKKARLISDLAEIEAQIAKLTH